MKTILRLSLIIWSVATLASCTDDHLPAANENTPRTTVYLQFGIDPYGRFDTIATRHDPCKWFDGIQNKAAQMTVQTLVPDASKPSGMREINPPQIFKRYPDFPDGDPNGLGVQLPESGGSIMIVTIYGEPNADCCPGPPPGRPIFRLFWPYGKVETSIRIRRMIPGAAPGDCLYF